MSRETEVITHIQIYNKLTMKLWWNNTTGLQNRVIKTFHISSWNFTVSMFTQLTFSARWSCISESETKIKKVELRNNFYLYKTNYWQRNKTEETFGKFWYERLCIIIYNVLLQHVIEKWKVLYLETFWGFLNRIVIFLYL